MFCIIRMTIVTLATLFSLFALPLSAQANHHTHDSSSTQAKPSNGDAAHGARLYSQVLVEQLEYRWQDGKDVMAWDAQAWAHER